MPDRDRPEVRMTTNDPTTSPTEFHPAAFLRQLDHEIERRQTELHALQHAREVLLGATGGVTVTVATAPAAAGARTPKTVMPRLVSHSYTMTPKTVADAVETILSAGPPNVGAYIRQLESELRARFGINISQKNLVNTLNRWVSRGRRFKRTAPNTYALLVPEGVEHPAMVPKKAVSGGRRRRR